MISFISLSLISLTLLASTPLQKECLKQHIKGSTTINKHYRCDYKVFKVPDHRLKKLSNNYPEFVGIQGLKEAHLNQTDEYYGSLTKFKKWAKMKQWENFGPIHHFDWWMFPISDESSQGYAYTVFSKEIKKLKKDKSFMKNYKKGIYLMFKSWCWNIKKGKQFKKCTQAQKWREYPVRLRKVVQSLILFKQKKWAKNAIKAANYFKVTLPKSFKMK